MIYAFIDGQNLYINNQQDQWKVDLYKFRVYLREKYGVVKAFYFIGAMSVENQGIYERIQDAGFILVFRKHTTHMTGKKKGNVDTDIVFSMLSKVIDDAELTGIVLVSGDGDYFRTVDYLIKKNLFVKLLAPNRHSFSSLYKPFTPKFVAFLDEPDVKKKIALIE